MPFVWIDNLNRQMERLPMLKALVWFVAAILLADHITLPLWSVVVGFLLCTLMAILLRHHRYANIYIVAALILAGFTATELQRLQRPTPTTPATLEIEVARITGHHLHNDHCEARLIAFHEQGEVYRSRAELRLTADSSLHIASGQRLLCCGSILPFDQKQSYGRYMTARGFVGEIRLSHRDIISRSEAHPTLGSRLQQYALERINRLRLGLKQEAIVRAIVIGDRSAITPSLRQSYTRAGAAHLLAISGLHIGFIALLANILLIWLTLFRSGQIIRCVAVIILIWLYAAMADFTPSVVRAATMFTLLQAALQTSSRTNALNTLCFTAFVMLALDSNMLYDAGFQLSMLSVAAIIAFAVPIYGHIGGRIGSVGRWLASGVVASAAATIVTAPLTLYLFGQASMWSIVSGMVMINLAAVVVGATMVWVIAPIGFMQGVASWLIDNLTLMMNTIAEWCEQMGLMTTELPIEKWHCIAAYMILALITLIVWTVRGRN